MISRNPSRQLVAQALHFCLIAALLAATFLLAQADLWFSALLTTLLTVVATWHLYHLQRRPWLLLQRLQKEEQAQQARRLEEEVKRQYYENLLDKVDTALLVADMEGRIEWMNRTATNLLGHQPLLPPQLLQLPAGETQLVRFERDGTQQEMVAGSSLFVALRVERRLISLKNIHTVLQRNELEAWQKLISVLTHEIMNSITPILSLSETLSEGGKEYNVMLQAVQVIHRRSKGLLNFVENYRRLTRLPSPQLTDVSVVQLFSDLRKLFPQECIRFLPPPPDALLHVDRGQIEQVLINLLKNALEATAALPAPDIEVKAAFSPSPFAVYYCVLSVTDNGSGIPPEVQEKIFIPLFTTKPTGSGIGLSLCKQVMSLHGGVITVRSEVGHGSSFMLGFRR
ncbi:MAG: PAS domain-containing sensor histidine kinase [Mediterranea sp.]|jgi:signal transduction histidine kinase|nr:PAS domain-containing sensor histidine kinase [Mediterranea sp.]